MSIAIATWNINSVRLRLPLVEHFLETTQPDVLCLQETKCPDGSFPTGAFHRLGYDHVAINGQKGYHGVAIVSKRPFTAVDKRDFCEKGDARHLAVVLDTAVGPLQLHDFYIPAGGDEPDPVINDKFAHKLAFLAELEAWLGTTPATMPSVVVGDLNIAPLADDVWSHKALLKVVSHTPIETAAFEAIRRGGGWIDVMRRFVPEPEKLYTWWSYRAADWAAADKGRRLDHVWASPDLDGRLIGVEVLRAARGWERPSDHVPVIARFDL
ncbi:exodeoxyribonuclease III [Siculibacillus lacustris]|uniref:Exodeoxyribonuclease III n=1 Tax=Siculibacillus lacustris TaxID=1549641 RepID=A0A4Q9VLD8_9HYPH|nr:exodeoxyribonuclease III [Siculibacillus lacustris]TBW36300.1 exodeoxyribonuclease III [Siculibacillus lacustris]